MPGRKGRGHRSQHARQIVTTHRCEVCGRRSLDEQGKPPRRKYALLVYNENNPQRAAHASCAALHP